MIIPKKKRKERLIEKQCAFVDENGKRCTKIFFGVGKKLYCKNHASPKYRKIIDKKKNDAKKKFTKDNSANIEIKHEYTEPISVTRNCNLCGTPYEIILLPSIYIYSKYDEPHRNQYKRELYLKGKS